jgi:hypothetical protein
MAWSFGDGFDLYATTADAANGYWDSVNSTTFSLVAGRFTGSRALQLSSPITVGFIKSSGVNDVVHHIVVAFQQTSALTGSVLGTYLQLVDGVTNQCCVVFRSDGAILLTSATPAGAVLATYTGAVTAISTWCAFEFEIVINNTTGRFRVRKNGNTIDDFDSGATLNTRPGANTYANKLQVGVNSSVSGQCIDDLFWRSDASSVAWMGDIRCYTRMPASDQSVQFSRSPTTSPLGGFGTASANFSTAVGNSFYVPLAPAYDGTISTLTISMFAAYTGNLKCSVFNSAGGNPSTILASATTLVNPTIGNNTITFSTPFTVTKSNQYWIGIAADGAANVNYFNSNIARSSTTTGYSTFPTASPTVSGNTIVACITWTIATNTNNCVVNEAQQDTTTSYVYDSTAGHADFYGIGTIASTPGTTIAVTTRGYMQKSDAGTRTAAVQLKSGATTVASPTLTLTTSGWLWAWRTDITDPNTSAAWTAAAVNAAQIGPTVVA